MTLVGLGTQTGTQGYVREVASKTRQNALLKTQPERNSKDVQAQVSQQTLVPKSHATRFDTSMKLRLPTG